MMSFFKTVAIVLVISIANPLCCCFSASADGERLSESQTSELHACCIAAQKAESATQDPQAHTPEDCPHKQAKDAQIFDATDGSDTLVKPNTFAFELLPALETNVLILAPADEDRPFGTNALSSPPATVAQAYCIFLL